MKIAVYGIGNILMSDDAVGPTVARILDAEWSLSGDVVVEDLGTPTIELPAHVAGFDAVVFIDAVTASAPPGTIIVYSREQILAHPPGLRVGPHDPSLRETLLTLDLTDDGPKHVVLVGIVAESAKMGLGLTPNVAAAIPAAVEQTLLELALLDVTATRRHEPRDADLWWSASVPLAPAGRPARR
jgi:hydrogenase maturation protease